MSERKAKSPGVETIYTTTVLLFAISIAGCQISSIGGDVRSVAREAQCRTNLRTLYEALTKYVSLHGDVPRDKDAKASLDPLDTPMVQKEVGIDPSVLRCPADKNPEGTSYVLNPALSIGDLRGDSTTIIACDRAPHHVGAYTHNPITVVLLGDGRWVRMDLPPKEQEEWRRLFLAGDKRACRVSMPKDLMVGSEVLWYVGEAKGYVPNE